MHDSSVAALHAKAAGQQGVSAGAMAGLDLAAGGAVMDPTTNLPMVTVEHVNCVRRLVDISVRIRDMWRRKKRGAHTVDRWQRRWQRREPLGARRVWQL